MSFEGFKILVLNVLFIVILIPTSVLIVAGVPSHLLGFVSLPTVASLLNSPDGVAITACLDCRLYLVQLYLISLPTSPSPW